MNTPFLVRCIRALYVWRVKYPHFECLITRMKNALCVGKPIVILTHDIGLSRGNRPGRGNMLLGRSLDGFQQQLKEYGITVPVYAQLGVALACEVLNIKVHTVIRPPTEDTRLDRSTLEWNSDTVIQMQVRAIADAGYTPDNTLALVLTWPDHAPRVRWLMERHGFTEIVPVPLLSYRSKKYFDPQALYPVMRWSAKVPGGTLIFRVYELMIRVLFIYKGLI